MKTGKISWFNNCLGYGFIKPDNRSEDVYVHLAETKTNPDCIYFTKGQRVKYSLIEDSLFPFASRIFTIDSDLVNPVISDHGYNYAQTV